MWTWIREKLQNVLSSLVVDGIKVLISFFVGLVGGVFAAPAIEGLGWIKVYEAGLPPGYESYGFVTQHFEDAKRELGSKDVVLEFQPVGLERLRFCGDANFDERERGEAFLNQLLARLGGCVVRAPAGESGSNTIAIRPGPEDSGFVSTERSLGPNKNTETLYFCGCPEKTVRLLESNTIYP